MANKITYKTIGYTFTRKSERNYTHAVVFRNVSRPEDIREGASFHSSLQAAQKEAKVKASYGHLEVIAVVEVEKVGA